MKQIIIPDVHGQTEWKDILNKHNDFDKVIFLGDYVDAFYITPEQQLNNLQDIVQFKVDNPDKVILLIGNHDHHYWPSIPGGGTSGYQPTMRPSFEHVFQVYKGLFQMVHVDDSGRFYSHAGVSRKWLELLEVPKILKDRQLADYINDLFTFTPYVFSFFSQDRSGYGNNPYQSPIWIRPTALYSSKIPNVQIVGHTVVERIMPLKSARQGYWLVDTLQTSKEFLVIEDEIKIDKL
jgi:hypothetical protein